MPRVIAPIPDQDDAFFWEGVADDRLLVRACAECGRSQHPPSPMCPACGSVSWTVQDLPTQGRVISWIASHHPTEPDADPRIVVLVELRDGHRLVSNLYGASTSEAINEMHVAAAFVEVAGVKLPGFVPADSVTDAG